MVTLTAEQQQLVENNDEFKRLIEVNDWNGLIKLLYSSQQARFNHHKILEFIYFDAGIDYLRYLDYVPEYAFYGSSVLENIAIPDNVTQIRGLAFAECPHLHLITIPGSVVNVDRTAFIHCNNLIIKCYKNSYIDKYAQENNIKVEYI